MTSPDDGGEQTDRLPSGIITTRCLQRHPELPGLAPGDVLRWPLALLEIVGEYVRIGVLAPVFAAEWEEQVGLWTAIAADRSLDSLDDLENAG